MSIQEYNSGPISNDLLESRLAKNTSEASHDSVCAHSAEGAPNIDDLPAVSTES